MTTVKRAFQLAALAAALVPAATHARGGPLSSPLPQPKPAWIVSALISDELAGGGDPALRERAYFTYSPSGGAGAFLQDPDVSYRLDLGTGSGTRDALVFGAGELRTRFAGSLSRWRSGPDLLANAEAGEFGVGRETNPLQALVHPDIDGGTQDYRGLASIWLDIEPSSPVTPYFGGGIGAAQLTVAGSGGEGVPSDDTDVVLAWQLGAGVSWNLLPNWAATLDYRWLNTSAPEFDLSPESAFDPDSSTHNVIAGVRLDF